MHSIRSLLGHLRTNDLDWYPKQLREILTDQLSAGAQIYYCRQLLKLDAGRQQDSNSSQVLQVRKFAVFRAPQRLAAEMWLVCTAVGACARVQPQARKTRATYGGMKAQAQGPLRSWVGSLCANQDSVAPRLLLLTVDSYKGAVLGSTSPDRVPPVRFCTFCLYDDIARNLQSHLPATPKPFHCLKALGDQIQRFFEVYSRYLFALRTSQRPIRLERVSVATWNRRRFWALSIVR